MRLIALRSPAATDLRYALSFIKVASNLERIGDYGKNMAKRSLVMEPSLITEQGSNSLRRMTKDVISMMNNALDAYVRKDVELAEAVIIQDKDIDLHYNALFREFLTFMMEDPKNITTCMRCGVCFWTFFGGIFARRNVNCLLSYRSYVIPNSFDIFRYEMKMHTRCNIFWVFHHKCQKFPEKSVIVKVNVLVLYNDGLR